MSYRAGDGFSETLDTRNEEQPRRVCPGCRKQWIDTRDRFCDECHATEKERWTEKGRKR